MRPPSYSCSHENRQVVEFRFGVQPNDRIRWAVGLRLGTRREPNCFTRRRVRLCSQGGGQKAGRLLKVESQAPGAAAMVGMLPAAERAGGKELLLGLRGRLE
jgi:hypothetical protein